MNMELNKLKQYLGMEQSDKIGPNPKKEQSL